MAVNTINDVVDAVEEGRDAVLAALQDHDKWERTDKAQGQAILTSLDKTLQTAVALNDKMITFNQKMLWIFALAVIVASLGNKALDLLMKVKP